MNRSPLQSPSALMNRACSETLGAAFRSFWIRTSSACVVKYLRLWPRKSSRLFEVVFFHEGKKFLAERPDQFVAEFHHTCADLNGICTHEDELSGVLARLHAADAGKRAAREFLPDHCRQFHAQCEERSA